MPLSTWRSNPGMNGSHWGVSVTDTVGCPITDAFATPEWRISPRTYSQQYETADGLVDMAQVCLSVPWVNSNQPHVTASTVISQLDERATVLRQDWWQ